MTRDELAAVFLEELGALAPEAELAALDREADLRDAIDLDSMDMLNLAIALHRRLGVEIPERDVGRLTTLAGALDYLAQRLAETGRPAEESAP